MTAGLASAEEAKIPHTSYARGLQNREMRFSMLQFQHRSVGVDDTFNTTMYDNLSLFCLMFINDDGHGEPGAFLMTDYKGHETLYVWLKSIPGLAALIWMTDYDKAIRLAIRMFNPKATLVLCIWHILRAWSNNINKQQCATREDREAWWAILNTMVRLISPLVVVDLWYW